MATIYRPRSSGRGALIHVRATTVYLWMKGSTWFFFFMVFTLAAIYRIEIGGLGPLMLVLVGTVMELSCFLFEVPTGVIADVYSRRLSMILGHGVMGLAFIVEGAWSWVGTILLAQCIFGVGYTMISGAEDAWLADEIGEARFSQVVLRGTQAEQVGSFLGIGASVFLASYDLRWPFWAAGLGLWLQALCLWRWMPERGFRRPHREVSGGSKVDGLDAAVRGGWSDLWHTFRRGLDATRRRPLLWTLMIVALCYGVASEGIDRLWEAHLLEQFHFPDWGGMSPLGWFGCINAAVLLCTFVATEGMQRYLHRRPISSSAASPTSLPTVAAAAPTPQTASLQTASPETGSPEMGSPESSETPALEVTASSERLLLLLAGQSVLVVFGLAVFALSDRFWLAVLAFVVVNVLRRLSRPVFLALINRGLDSSVRATVLSTVNQMDAIGQVSGGPGVGWIGSRFGLRAALMTVALLLTPVWIFYRRAWKQIVESETDPAP